MPRIRGAVLLFSLQHGIAPALDLLPCLQAQGGRDYKKGSKFKKGAIKCCKENKLNAQTYNITEFFPF